ncbi:chorismate-binding protein [Carboxydochorda subterranea]|uniref:Chorismate-binding protein n=1 Tax=Carboxydichorda subterranea TaxID=3109565 RepID=A0ABZ1C0V2_9FIRM|nr:chorismate-binding protein [Limnochorda sp. L945t]WRP18513.1 chorismate-binding protein [Limnochorda sp. L945t]
MQLHPDRGRFVELLERTGAAVLCASFLTDTLTPLVALNRLGPHPLGRFLLESADHGGRLGRFSFVGSGGAALVAFEEGLARVYEAGEGGAPLVETERRAVADPIAYLRDRWRALELPESAVRELLAPLFPHADDVPPFVGGAVGFFGYDLVRTIEPLGPGRPATLPGWMGAYLLADAVVVFDHFRGTGYLLTLARRRPGETARQAHDRAAGRLQAVWERLAVPSGRDPGPAFAQAGAAPGGLEGGTAGLEEEDPAFEAAVRQARRHIEAGDVFQVVLSREVVAPCRRPPLEVFRHLRAINPSPYMFYLEIPDPRSGSPGPLHLVGASPEVMVRSQQERAMLRPIAGTRPRGRDAAEQARLESELASDPKELAEHMMLVDLGRNDLGRVCRYGTVEVSRLLEIERYSHVTHLVSQVQGVLRPGQDAFDLLRATFPAGTVTGAPKVRAMQVIDALEASGRGPYAGTVGYFSASGNADHCITIRTLAIYGERAVVRAGAGIVADSDPRRELRETQHKARAMLSALAATGEVHAG